MTNKCTLHVDDDVTMVFFNLQPGVNFGISAPGPRISQQHHLHQQNQDNPPFYHQDRVNFGKKSEMYGNHKGLKWVKLVSIMKCT